MSFFEAPLFTIFLTSFTPLRNYGGIDSGNESNDRDNCDDGDISSLNNGGTGGDNCNILILKIVIIP